MKYMILTFGDEATMREERSPEWIREMISFMGELNGDLTDAGEMVTAEGLTDASQAKTVRYEGGRAVPTDGPFAESKESLAGWWIVDVESEDRALEIAARIVDFVERPIEIRRVADAPPEA
jgi:hypothetical protein